MSEKYWIIDYDLEFLSDFHVGAGINLLGGNRQGLRLDEAGFPIIPHTEIRGLLRFSGYRLKEWQGSLENCYRRNFGVGGGESGNWSYTSARFQKTSISPESHGILSQHTHICGAGSGEKRLFTHQKAGAGEERAKWQGRLYSTVKASERDVEFMLAAMRVEDRLGLGRSRGYGKVAWVLKKIRSFAPGDKPSEETVDIRKTLEKLL